MPARFHLHSALITHLILITAIFPILLGTCVAFADVQSKKIMILGDSLSAAYGMKQHESWVSLLENKLKREESAYQVVNESISGDTTANGLNRLPEALKKHRPAIVIVELGGNDGLRGQSLKYIQSNLEKIILTCQQQGARVLLAQIRIPPNYGRRYTERFSKIYPDLAKKYQITLLPFILDDIAGNPQLMQNDGIHPKAIAQPLIMDAVWKPLKAMIDTL